MSRRSLVVLRNPVPNWDASVLEPRFDFDLIRQQTQAEYASFDTRRLAFLSNEAGTNNATGAALRAWSARADVDNIFTTGEDIAFRLLPMLQASGWKGQLFSVIHACQGPKWQLAARLLGTRSVGAYFTVANLQRDFLVKNANLPAGKVHFLYDSVDADFFDPDKAIADPGESYAFACGLENRDYATLAAAVAGLRMPVRVQSSGFFPNDTQPGKDTQENLAISRTRISFSELRDLYGSARFIVVPLHSVSYAAGVNGLLEGMAMGKAVIVSGSPGLADYTGIDSVITVPVADPASLAAAMDALWRDPAACEQMGRANRDWVLRNATIETYATTISNQMLEA